MKNLQGKNCNVIRLILFCYVTMLPFGIFFMLGPKNLNAQQFTREKVIAAYTFNFAQNIEWPNEASIEDFRFNIITGDHGMVEAFRKMSGIKKVKNKPVIIIAEERSVDIDDVQLVIVAKDKEELVAEIIDKIEGKNILLITDQYDDKKIVMINFHETKDNRLLFEINKANIINQGLKVLPEMVLLGGTEIDVAKLYKESQDMLRIKENQLVALEQRLDSLNAQIKTSSEEISEQKALINKQKRDILLQHEQMKNQQDKIKRQQVQIESQQEELEGVSADLKKQQDTLSRQNDLLNNSRKLLEQQQREIEGGKAILAEQQLKIERQSAAIQSQKKVLDQQGSTIRAQKIILYLLIGIVILTIGLSYTLFWGYRNKQRSNQQIQKLNRDLQTRAVALEKANKELDAFAYSVSHDLRAPLRHIDGFMELLQKSTSGVLDEKSRHYMATILDASGRMGILIDELLSFSRMGRQDIFKTKVDLTSLVREVIREELGPGTQGGNILWRISDLLVVNGDPAMLKIVLTNLISNALKFTRSVQQPEIEIGRMPDANKETIIFMRDNGVGFDPAYTDKLFGVFQRLHRADEFEGIGIGLANVRRIISRHGGRTWAEGAVDRGATFYFSLPHA